MAILSQGRLRDRYITVGSFALRRVTILISEDTEFMFLSEDSNDILIAERTETSNYILRNQYKNPGEITTKEIDSGMVRSKYKTQGTYSQEL